MKVCRLFLKHTCNFLWHLTISMTLQSQAAVCDIEMQSPSTIGWTSPRCPGGPDLYLIDRYECHVLSWSLPAQESTKLAYYLHLIHVFIGVPDHMNGTFQVPWLKMNQVPPLSSHHCWHFIINNRKHMANLLWWSALQYPVAQYPSSI